MNTTHIRLMKKSLTAAAAGKVALSAGTASAALGKAEETQTDPAGPPPISLEQIGTPLDLLTPPLADLDPDTADGTLGKAGGDTSFSGSDFGTLWAGELMPPTTDTGTTDDGSKTGDTTTTTTDPAPAIEARVDFIVNGIRNDMEMRVFLAYATAAGRADRWQPTATGQLELDPDSIQVLAALNTRPQAALREFPDTPLGYVPEQRSRSVIVPLVLSDLSDPSLAGDEIHFQAIAIPVAPADQGGGFMWEQAQVTELDSYIIQRFVDSTDAGSKSSDDSLSGKTGDDTTMDDGTTTDDTGGK